jgi:hypothetical protein
VWGRVVEGVREQRYKQKAIRCRACYYSIMLNTHRVTSMADTDIDSVKKQKNAKRIKQYRLKRKLLTSTKKVNVYLSSLMMKVPDHVYILG